MRPFASAHFVCHRVFSSVCADPPPASSALPFTLFRVPAETRPARCTNRHPVRPQHGSVRTDAEFVWVLDPIDGTKSFITGKPLFGTLIGLCHHGVPTIGIIDQCVLKERWLGIRGVKTELNGERVHATGCAKLSEAMLYATTPHMFAEGDEANAFARVRDTVKRPLYGCDCYAYGLVASGFGADLVVEADLGLYDYTALVPVLLGAGGCMTDWTGAELTIANHEASKGRVLATANKGLHAEALTLLQQGGGTKRKAGE
jgi:histidinol phosphatase-like enzyme (inositol monophosphatase family)